MYSWGDDTYTWKSPGAYSYGEAMKPYLEKTKKKADDLGERSYLSKKAPNLKLVDPLGKEISSESTDPIIIGVDGTGSFQKWPAEIFDRLPLFYQTLSKHKPNIDVSFSVIGDASPDTDKWPLQISDFGKDVTLDSYLKALQPEGGGGPGIRESYELWAYFMLNHAKTPKATSPFMFIIADEKFYEKVDPAQVKKYIGDTPQEPLDSREIWRSLTQRFDLYLLRKSYAGRDAEIESQWKDVLLPQHIIPVYDPERVVDVAMGIVAKRWNVEGDFMKSLKARQEDEGVEVVLKSLRAAPDVGKGLKSTMKKQIEGKKSVKLLGE